MAGGHRVVVGGRHRVDGPGRHPHHVEPRCRTTARLRRRRDLRRTRVARLVPTRLRADVEEQMALVRGGMHVPTRDTVRLHKNGHEIEVAEALSLIREPTGAATGISAVLRDITARKRAERELRRLLVDGQRRERWLGAISEVRLSMLAGGGLEQWLALIARRASELSDADGITVSVVAENDDTRLGGDRHARRARGAVAGQARADRRTPRRDGSSPRVAPRSRPSPRRCSTSTVPDAVPDGLGPLLLVPITTSHGNDGVLGVVRLVGRAGVQPRGDPGRRELRTTGGPGHRARPRPERPRAARGHGRP